MAAVLTGGLICVSCGSDEPKEGQVGHLQDNFGGVASGEPRSALVGRDVLSAGGNAVDAIVATYFALSVTYPGAASLGGGGICVVFRGESGDVEAIDFRPALYEAQGRAAMIPGSVRGMFALHARYGRLNWAGLLLPAERLARFGNPVARAFARKLSALPPQAFSNPEVRRIFTSAGKPWNEGQTLRQPQLSTTLAQIRLRGPGDFYAGELAKTLSEGLSQAVGIPVPVSAFRSYRPKWSEPETVDFGKNQIILPGGSVGAAAAARWRAATAGSQPGSRDQAKADSIGFTAVDLQGGAAACVVGTNATLGAGRMIGPSGVLMAAPPRGAGISGIPLLFVNKPLAEARGAATGAGGAEGAARAISAAVKAFGSDIPLESAFGPQPKDDRARANLIRCPEGAREEPSSCRFATDPNGHGLAISASF